MALDTGLSAFRYAGNGYQAVAASSGSSFTAMPFLVDGSSKNARLIGCKVVSTGTVPTCVYIRTSPSSLSSALVGDIPVNSNETVYLFTGGDSWVSVLADTGTVRCNVWPVSW